MVSRLRERGEAFVTRHLQGKGFSLSGRIPSRRGAWLEFTFEAATEPDAGGERLRLRARTTLNLRGRALRSWLEVRSSSAALDDGSRALVPERLSALGITPQAGKPMQTWAGALAGPRPAFALLTLMQFDKERLPLRVQHVLGPKPLHLTATLANVVEEV
jgi:hypothetical protein